jgi:hypothetical protein
MINFRFHLVSLIAVFLALGLGILVGSTVVDQVIVDQLRGEIRDVRRESSERGRESDQLREEMSRLDDFQRASATFAVEDRLTDVPVAIVVERGVDRDTVKELLAIVRAAGAEVPGILWLDERWKLDRPEERADLEDAARVSGNAATARSVALKRLANRLAEAPDEDARDVLEALRDAGFVELTDGNADRLAEFPVRAVRVLVVTGTNSRLADSNTLVDLVQGLVDADVPTVVAEVYDDHDGALPEPQRGAPLAPVRGNSTLNKQVSTLDDGELVAGRVTAVIALEQAATGTLGHYGYGQGANDAAPSPAS